MLIKPHLAALFRVRVGVRVNDKVGVRGTASSDRIRPEGSAPHIRRFDGGREPMNATMAEQYIEANLKMLQTDYVVRNNTWHWVVWRTGW